MSDPSPAEDKYASRERLARMLWDNYPAEEKTEALNAFAADVAKQARSGAFSDAADWFRELKYLWTASELERLAVQGLPYNPEHR